MASDAEPCPLCGAEIEDLLDHWDTPEGEGCPETPNPELFDNP